MKELALYGVGDLGLEIYELYKRCNAVSHEYDDAFYVDDDPEVVAPDGMRLVDFDGLLAEGENNEVEVAICVGEPRIRKIIADKLEGKVPLATLIHPTVEVPDNATIGAGCIVYRDCYIGPNAKIGSDVLLIRCAIAHDCVVGDHCVFSSGATLSGHDVVGELTYVALGAIVKEGISIGSRSIVGMGSAVFRDVPDDMIVLGNPARAMRKNENQTVFKS